MNVWSVVSNKGQKMDVDECVIYVLKPNSFLFCYFTEPSTEIIGAPDLYIESGSTINLTCVVNNSPEPPAFIFWNHNNAVSR